ncbi:flavin reductase (NADPH)-like [Phyllobates terribilis]|uniref:flavin reductase (NADPH)-like n=1 Tax=Phyllobates terribilis TaxID=111132 RepID=UPI003CCB40E7
MKLSVLGATGQTGAILVTQALQDGHEVTALVRNVRKMTIQHERLKVVEANIFSVDSLAEHFKGQDAVVSCLGFPYKMFSSISGYTDSMTAIVGAMRQTGVNRMVTMTSWYTDINSAQNASFFVRTLYNIIKSVLTNMFEMEKYLENECSDLNWTVVRPPGLQNTPVTDKEILTNEGYFVPDEKGYPITNIVSRADVSRFMLSTLNDLRWTRTIVAMCCKM